MTRILAGLFTLVGVAVASDAPAQGASGNPERARSIASAVCSGCHGPDGNSVQAVHPKLAGLQAQYIAKQLKDYQAGKRLNEVMGPVAGSLSPENVEDLAAYYNQQKPAPGTVRDKALLDLGRKVYEDGNAESGVPSCSGCHYPDGSGTARFPRLAGQHPEYTLNQLKQFGASKRENDRGLVMQSVALRMTEQEMKAVAEYVASLP
ncbi:MAG: cytochrome c4 [Betaproteobacteria bacterium]|nr:cytochrome c4 [Betaproteobacteria bacterium]